MSNKQITDHPFIPSKRWDSCDWSVYPEDADWTVCDHPKAAHEKVAPDGYRIVVRST